MPKRAVDRLGTQGAREPGALRGSEVLPTPPAFRQDQGVTEGRTEGVHGNQKKWAQRTWRLDAAMDAITALTIKGVARAILRLSWIRHGGDAVQCVFVMPRCN